MAGTITLGEGRLNWNRYERIGDRYGTVHLHDGAERYADWKGAPVGSKGALAAEILETRKSGHVGDWARGIGPSTPEVGEVITLGTGTLFTENTVGVPDIGVSPDDGRQDDWMDPRALYRCHEQTVRLTFTPDE